MTLPKMYIVHPKRYLFRRLEVGGDAAGCLFRLYGLRVGIRSWFRRMLYGRDDFCEFGVYRDRIELTDEFQRTVISPRLDTFGSGWSRSWLAPSVAAIGLIITLFAIWSAPGKFIGFCIVAALGALVWHIYRRSLTLSLSMKDDAGRKIVFDLKRGDFSGPPLPEDALNEMVEAISYLRQEHKKEEQTMDVKPSANE